MTHLLVTNDFPPKTGGIQSYLYELWRRLDPSRFVVVTHEDATAEEFDAEVPFRIVRLPGKILLPTPQVRLAINSIACAERAELVLLDPALPLGSLGPFLDVPYGLVLHGAEVTVPGHLPGLAWLLGRTIVGAAIVVAAGGYPLAEARRVARPMPDVVVVPPGVDATRFHPLTQDEQATARRHFGLPAAGPLVVSVSRLVPRKGMDVLIEVAASLRSRYPELTVAIGGSGRDESRLRRLIERLGSPVAMLGHVPDAELPLLTGAADIWTMLCRDRWLGLEQEGFGIVFLEAAAAGVAVIAGQSGGAGDAVVDGVTGLVVDRPGDVVPATVALRALLDDPAYRSRLATTARARALAEFDQHKLALRLGEALAVHGG
jgi:phosphatidylinositol alpha-1,6-mannosyltransferase